MQTDSCHKNDPAVRRLQNIPKQFPTCTAEATQGPTTEDRERGGWGATDAGAGEPSPSLARAVAQFDRDGVLRIPSVLPPGLACKLREASPRKYDHNPA